MTSQSSGYAENCKRKAIDICATLPGEGTCSEILKDLIYAVTTAPVEPWDDFRRRRMAQYARQLEVLHYYLVKRG